MDGDDPVGVVEREVAAHVAADVPARRAEPLVAEDAHQLGPQAGDGDGVERRAGRAVGVPVARHVGHDDVERVGGVGAVRAGVGEERDDLRVAPERVRPAVAEDQRQHRPGRRDGPGVHEVDPEPAERDAEAGEPGERRLLRRPVEPVRPVGDELAQVVEVGPERPAGVLGRVRPARRAQPRAEVLQRRRGGLRGERLGAGRQSGMPLSLGRRSAVLRACDTGNSCVMTSLEGGASVAKPTGRFVQEAPADTSVRGLHPREDTPS